MGQATKPQFGLASRFAAAILGLAIGVVAIGFKNDELVMVGIGLAVATPSLIAAIALTRRDLRLRRW